MKTKLNSARGTSTRSRALVSALLLPLSIAFFLGGAALTAIWVALEIPVGPGAAVSYTLPTPVP